MEINKFNQENINAYGDVVARDKIEQNINVTNVLTPATDYMIELIKKFKAESSSDEKINKIVENLNHYSTNLDEETIYDLEYKLNAGNRGYEYGRAVLLKERITKKIKLNENSEAAQEIYAYLLSQICSDFHLHIYPLLKTHTISQINLLIDEKVIKPAVFILGENVLKLLKEDINGMIYFLTGNCHIKWE